MADSFVSVPESKITKLLESNFDEVHVYTRDHMMKTYPGGLRTDSSNMNPMPQWVAGIQVG